MFIAVFSLFVLAVVVLSVLTVRWALRRDGERRRSEGPTGQERP